jgi:DNA-binding Lrp family transcriptional regulator
LLELVKGARSTAPPLELADAAVARLVTRLSSEYLLRVIQLTVEVFGDVKLGLVAQAIGAANTAHFNTPREAWGRRAVGSGSLLPNEVRRPISISALAASTGLPFETTRRAVQRLIESGACLRVEGGVIMPIEAVRRPMIAQAVVANFGYVRRFLRDLEAAGFVGGAARWTQQADDALGDTVDARVVGRLSGEYLLRALQLLIDAYGDIHDGILAHTIVTANTSHLDARGGEGWRYAGVDQAPPDDERRPISVARLAESLGLPFETTRRHVGRLMDAGVCIRIEGGLIVPQAVLERPAAARSALANVGYVRRFVRDVLASSERESVRAAPT